MLLRNCAFVHRSVLALSTVVPPYNVAYFLRLRCFAEFIGAILHVFLITAQERALCSTRFLIWRVKSLNFESIVIRGK